MKSISRPQELPRPVLAWAFAAAFVPQPVTYICTGCGLEHMPRDGRAIDGQAHRCCRNGGEWRISESANSE